MPRSPSGDYTLPPSNPVASGTTITSDWANTTMGDVANELSNSLSRDGQGGMRAPMKFADGTNIAPSITFNSEDTLGIYRAAQATLSMAGEGVQFARFTRTNQIEVYRNNQWEQVATVNEVSDLDAETVKKTSDTGSADMPTGTTGERDVSPQAGYLRFNTTVGALEVYNGSEWQFVGTDVGAALNFEFTASDGQTDFTGVDDHGETMQYNPDAVEVFLNGSRLGIDNYTATDGVTVTLAEPAILNDELQVKSWELVGLPDVVKKSGDTMTGTLNIDAATSLTTTGNVGIGTSSPSAPIHLKTTGSAELRLEQNGVGYGSIKSSDFGILYLDADAGNTAASSSMRFRVDGTERMRIDSSGHAIIPAGITLGTAAGVYNPAKTLDDYEEGTWTPTFVSSTNTNITGITVTSATYTKIGNNVTVQAQITPTGTSSAFADQENILIGGLPFLALDYSPTVALSFRTFSSGTHGSLTGYVWGDSISLIMTTSHSALTDRVLYIEAAFLI